MCDVLTALPGSRKPRLFRVPQLLLSSCLASSPPGSLCVERVPGSLFLLRALPCPLQSLLATSEQPASSRLRRRCHFFRKPWRSQSSWPCFLCLGSSAPHPRGWSWCRFARFLLCLPARQQASELGQACLSTILCIPRY